MPTSPASIVRTVLPFPLGAATVMSCRHRGSDAVESAMPDHENVPLKPSPLSDAPAVQLDQAIQEVSTRTQLLVIQCSAIPDRHALAKHLTTLAYASSSRAAGRTRRVDAYLDLAAHPSRPARSVTPGRTAYWDDLAAGLPAALARSQVLAIDAPEPMLETMPMRLTRFIQWFAQQGKLVVILTADAQRILDLDLAPLSIQTDTVLTHHGQELYQFREMAMSVIAAASSRSAPGEPY